MHIRGCADKAAKATDPRFMVAGRAAALLSLPLSITLMQVDKGRYSMTPEELAKYREDKLAKETTAKVQKEADKVAERKRIDDENLAAENALKEQVLPYLAKAKGAIGALEFTPVNDTSNRITGVNLRLGNASARISKSPVGRISAVATNSKQGITGKPFQAIQSASDLTEENLSELIKSLIDAE